MRLVRVVMLYTTNKQKLYFIRAEYSVSPAVIAYFQNALHYEIPYLSGLDVRLFQTRNKRNCRCQDS
jgi:hypothetical protein